MMWPISLLLRLLFAGTSPVLYLVDEKFDFVSVRIYSSLALLALEDLVKPLALLAVSNLQLRQQSGPVPSLYAGEQALFSTNPKEAYLQEDISRLKTFVEVTRAASTSWSGLYICSEHMFNYQSKIILEILIISSAASNRFSINPNLDKFNRMNHFRSVCIFLCDLESCKYLFYAQMENNFACRFMYHWLLSIQDYEHFFIAAEERLSNLIPTDFLNSCESPRTPGLPSVPKSNLRNNVSLFIVSLLNMLYYRKTEQWNGQPNPV